MAPAPTVSIALSMHNAAGTIEPALRSMLAQSRTDWELILVDDGSSDDSLARARRYADPRFLVIADGQRRGLAARLNQAVCLARGNYIARMDADDIAYPDRLERQVAFLEMHRDVDLLGSGAMAFSGSGEPLGLLPVYLTHEKICAAPWSGFHLAHPTWMGRREWFQRFHYRPQALRAQDQDLLLCAYRDSRLACLPDPLLGYRQERASVYNVLRGRYHYARALWRAGEKRGEWGLALRGVVTQGARAAVAAAGIVAGGGERILRRRFAAASEAQLAQWRQVWAEVSSTRGRVAP